MKRRSLPFWGWHRLEGAMDIITIFLSPFWINNSVAYIYILYTYLNLEPQWPLFLKVNPPKQGLFQPKQGSFGFQEYTYGDDMYANTMSSKFQGSKLPEGQTSALLRRRESDKKLEKLQKVARGNRAFGDHGPGLWKKTWVHKNYTKIPHQNAEHIISSFLFLSWADSKSFFLI